MRQAAAAITRCAQLCVQVRGLHLLNGTERDGERKKRRERKEEARGEAGADQKPGFLLCTEMGKLSPDSLRCAGQFYLKAFKDEEDS